MPILIKSYDWSQTDSWVQVRVKNVRWSKHSDTVLSQKYFKANYGAQNILELFLEGTIDVSKSRMTLDGDNLTLDLCKDVPGDIWSSLDLRSSLSKEEQMRLRLEANAWIQKHKEDQSKRLAESSLKLERKSIEERIAMDEKFKMDIKHQKNNIMDEFITSPNEVSQIRKNDATNHKNISRGIYDTSLLVQVAVEKDRIKPPIRSPGCIMVSFTPRNNPTPLREDVDDGNVEWLRKKFSAYAKSQGAQITEDGDELRLDQILSQGECFMRSGDVCSAIAIYTHGLKAHSGVPALYNNRSIAHMKLHNYQEALQDTNRALKCLLPPVETNCSQRAKAHLRKSFILFKLGRRSKAISELETASSLMPGNKEIASQMESLRHDENLDENGLD